MSIENTLVNILLYIDLLLGYERTESSFPLSLEDKLMQREMVGHVETTWKKGRHGAKRGA